MLKIEPPPNQISNGTFTTLVIFIVLLLEIVQAKDYEDHDQMGSYRYG